MIAVGTDVERFTALTTAAAREGPPFQLFADISYFFELVSEYSVRHGGEVLWFAGDGAIILFTGTDREYATSALLFAQELQREVAHTLGRHVNQQFILKFRVSVGMGPLEVSTEFSPNGKTACTVVSGELLAQVGGLQRNVPSSGLAIAKGVLRIVDPELLTKVPCEMCSIDGNSVERVVLLPEPAMAFLGRMVAFSRLQPNFKEAIVHTAVSRQAMRREIAIVYADVTNAPGIWQTVLELVDELDGRLYKVLKDHHGLVVVVSFGTPEKVHVNDLERALHFARRLVGSCTRPESQIYASIICGDAVCQSLRLASSNHRTFSEDNIVAYCMNMGARLLVLARRLRRSSIVTNAPFVTEMRKFGVSLNCRTIPANSILLRNIHMASAFVVSVGAALDTEPLNYSLSSIRRKSRQKSVTVPVAELVQFAQRPPLPGVSISCVQLSQAPMALAVLEALDDNATFCTTICGKLAPPWQMFISVLNHAVSARLGNVEELVRATLPEVTDSEVCEVSHVVSALLCFGILGGSHMSLEASFAKLNGFTTPNARKSTCSDMGELTEALLVQLLKQYGRRSGGLKLVVFCAGEFQIAPSNLRVLRGLAEQHDNLLASQVCIEVILQYSGTTPKSLRLEGVLHVVNLTLEGSSMEYGHVASLQLADRVSDSEFVALKIFGMLGAVVCEKIFPIEVVFQTGALACQVMRRNKSPAAVCGGRCVTFLDYPLAKDIVNRLSPTCIRELSDTLLLRIASSHSPSSISHPLQIPRHLLAAISILHLCTERAREAWECIESGLRKALMAHLGLLTMAGDGPLAVSLLENLPQNSLYCPLPDLHPAYHLQIALDQFDISSLSSLLDRSTQMMEGINSYGAEYLMAWTTNALVRFLCAVDRSTVPFELADVLRHCAFDPTLWMTVPLILLTADEPDDLSDIELAVVMKGVDSLCRLALSNDKPSLEDFLIHRPWLGITARPAAIMASFSSLLIGLRCTSKLEEAIALVHCTQTVSTIVSVRQPRNSVTNFVHLQCYGLLLAAHGSTAILTVSQFRKMMSSCSPMLAIYLSLYVSFSGKVDEESREDGHHILGHSRTTLGKYMYARLSDLQKDVSLGKQKLLVRLWSILVSQAAASHSMSVISVLILTELVLCAARNRQWSFLHAVSATHLRSYPLVRFFSVLMTAFDPLVDERQREVLRLLALKMASDAQLRRVAATIFVTIQMCKESTLIPWKNAELMVGPFPDLSMVWQNTEGFYGIGIGSAMPDAYEI